MAMTEGPMIRIFLFFTFTSMTIGGIAGFLAIIMMQLYDADLAGGNFSLTVFMVAMAGAVLFGGVLADRISAHDRLAMWTVGRRCGGARAARLRVRRFPRRARDGRRECLPARHFQPRRAT